MSNQRHLRHNLRTPLHHIIGYGEMVGEELAADPLGDAVRGPLNGLFASARALLHLINAAPEDAASRPEAFGDWQAPLAGLEHWVDRLSAAVSGHSPAWLPDLDKIRHASGVLRALFDGLLEPCTDVLPPQPAAPGAPLGEDAAGLGPAGRGRAGRVLVVDDNDANLDLLARRLAREGYEVSLADSGPAALALIGARPAFDVILLDLLMPGMSGQEVLVELRGRHSLYELPVIALTARHSSRIIVEALEAGANDYITKPVDFPVVLARINTQLYLRRITEELRQANERLRAYSYLDGLTGIPNRRRFDEFVQEQWNAMVHGDHAFALVMIDVDHFKLYNDHYGHEAGDRVLVRIAQALQSAVDGTGGLVARYGGEEFVAVLPRTELQAAMALADRMRERVMALGIPHYPHPTEDHVTISVGVATDHPVGPLVPGLLVQRADEALYRSKRSGRNRVYKWPKEQEAE